MNARLKAFNEPVTPARAALAIACLLLLAGGGFGVRAIWHWKGSRPKSAASVQGTIRDYLAKQARKKDFTSSFAFNLGRSVSDLHTNLVRQRDEVTALRTNLVTAQKHAQVLGRELADSVDQERVVRRAAMAAAEALATAQKRLAARESELFQVRSNLVAASNALATATIDGANKKGGEARTALQAGIGNLEKSAATAETNFYSTRTNVEALTAQSGEKQELLNLRQKELAAKKEAMAGAQGGAKELGAKLAERETALTALRREVNAKDQALATQVPSFVRELRNEVKEAPTYESIYGTIGRCLWTADRLLASDEPASQRQGVLLSQEAASFAIQGAENYWLGARICEGYVWPNLDRFDGNGKARAAVYSALQLAAGAFTKAGETNHLVKNYQYQLKYATTPRATDSLRYSLANLLEQSGDYNGALDLYTAIQDSNYLRYAQQRIAGVEQKRAKAQKN